MTPRVLIYLLRRDLRVADNPVLHELVRDSHRCTHLLPVYVFPAQQIEVSGFLAADAKSPFPAARSPVGGFWRCGPHRARWIAESVWDLKKGLEKVGSGLEIRVGMLGQVVRELLEGVSEGHAEVAGVWMTAEEGSEEKREEADVRRIAHASKVDFRLFNDEKYFVDDRDLRLLKPADLPNVFTSFKKQHEPLRDAPRRTLKSPTSLPPLPAADLIAHDPSFYIPPDLDGLIANLLKPLDSMGLSHPPKQPTQAKSAHPFHGGETTGHDRIRHLLSNGSMTSYKDTRNGMLGTDFSTKLSAWLALGSITSRQIHEYLLAFENGTSDLGKGTPGYGKGENKGTAAVRFELLWRDYFRLCTRKFGSRLFHVGGFKDDRQTKWSSFSDQPQIKDKITRFLEGRTGNGFIDASMRELFLSGYTSNRLRQNVASFFAKHMGMDWRIGAEWYEALLVDYDVSSNWGNWQYVAGVGNDPRESRMFNPVKQGFDYDPQGAYVKMWVEALRGLDDPNVLFQPWKLDGQQKSACGLAGDVWVEEPLQKIQYDAGRGRGARRGGGKPRGGFGRRGMAQKGGYM